MVVAPFLKLTVPVGVPAAGAVVETVAVSVTVCAEVAGLGAAVSAVLVAPWLTVKLTAVDVDVAKSASLE